MGLKQQFVVIGLGRFGSSVAKTLHSLGKDVLAIDQFEDTVQSISGSVTHAVAADSRDENVLKSLGVGNFEVAIVAIGSNIESSILVTLLLKELGVKYVIAKAQNEYHAKVLKKIGADRVIFPERDMGVKLAHNLLLSNIQECITQDCVVELSNDYSVVEIVAPRQWVGKALGELNMRSKHGINVIAIKHGKDINVSPSAEDVIHEDDVLVVIGGTDDLDRIERIK